MPGSRIEAAVDALRRLADEDGDPSVRAEAAVALQALQFKGSLPSGAAFLPGHFEMPSLSRG